MPQAERKILRLAMLGTSTLRRILRRSNVPLPVLGCRSAALRSSLAGWSILQRL